jgi:hypothetical protein
MRALNCSHGTADESPGETTRLEWDWLDEAAELLIE